MRVMVAEDDSALSLFLKKALELDGHIVRQISDGAAAVERVQEDMPDMLVLDLGLPHMDGVDVLRALHDRVPSMSILVLTGRSQLAEKIECLNLGADDYLLKPFSMHEMLARCRAIGRRRMGASASVLQHGGLQMDRIQRLVTYEGAVLDFTSKEFTLLEYLLLQKGRSVSRKELLENVWQMSPDAGTNVVDVCHRAVSVPLEHGLHARIACGRTELRDTRWYEPDVASAACAGSCSCRCCAVGGFVYGACDRRRANRRRADSQCGPCVEAQSA